MELVRKKRHVSKEQILGVTIMLNHSYFEIPSPKVPFVLEELNKRVYNGRKIFAEEANSKPKKNVQKDFENIKTEEKKKKSKSKNVGSVKIQKEKTNKDSKKKNMEKLKNIKKSVEIKW